MANIIEEGDKCRYCVSTTRLMHLDSEKISDTGYDTPRELITAATGVESSNVDGPQKVCHECYAQMYEVIMVVRLVETAEVMNQY